MAGDFQACGEEAHSGTGAVIEVTTGYCRAQRGSLTQPGGSGGDIRHLEEVRLSYYSFAGLHMVSVVP